MWGLLAHLLGAHDRDVEPDLHLVRQGLAVLVARGELGAHVVPDAARAELAQGAHELLARDGHLDGRGEGGEKLATGRHVGPPGCALPVAYAAGVNQESRTNQRKQVYRKKKVYATTKNVMIPSG